MDHGLRPRARPVWHDIQRDNAHRRVVCKRPVARPGAAVASVCRATCIFRSHERGYDPIWNSTECWEYQ
eukprot:27780-Pyramimonas_sp.AAC.1